MRVLRAGAQHQVTEGDRSHGATELSSRPGCGRHAERLRAHGLTLSFSMYNTGEGIISNWWRHWVITVTGGKMPCSFYSGTYLLTLRAHLKTQRLAQMSPAHPDIKPETMTCL